MLYEFMKKFASLQHPIRPTAAKMQN